MRDAWMKLQSRSVLKSRSTAKASRRSFVAIAVNETLEPRRLLSAYTLTTIANLSTAVGNVPEGGVIMDSAGNLYGTAEEGGDSGIGDVFEVPAGGGSATKLASFTGGGSQTNGEEPAGGLLMDSHGNLFGTSNNGGPGQDGTVFELPTGGGINVLGFFDGVPPDGAFPSSTLVMDASGNLYGTTGGGGASNEGAIFEEPSGGGTPIILASMTQAAGATPQPGLIMDSAGNLYGVSEAGGPLVRQEGLYGNGQIFELAKGASSITVLATFDGDDGAVPITSLTMDASGDLFGTASEEGGNGNGTVFELAKGSSTITTVASFELQSTGGSPASPLLLDSSGDLFGTTTAGGPAGDGTAFEIVHGSGTITTLVDFEGTNGSSPQGNLVMDSSGDIFGATALGGSDGIDDGGTVYELSPAPIGPAAQLAFASAPASANVGSVVTPFTVDVEDSNGSIVTTDTSTVTLSGASLTGTTSVAAVDGVATFSDVVINGASTSYTLTASDGSLTSATTPPFVVSSSGGGGGGGSGSGGLTPVVASSTVPAAVVGGATLHGVLKLKLTDSLSTTEKGFTVNIYASTSPILDTTTDTLVTSITKSTISIKTEKSAAVSVPITKLPAGLTNGSYYLIAESIDGEGNVESVATTSPVTIAAPFVSLSESLTTTLPNAIVSGTTAKGAVILTITNGGNIPSKGLTPIDVTASTVPGVLGTTITTLTKNLNILPGKSVKVAVPIKNTPALADGSYYLVAEVTDAFANGTSIGSSAGTITVAAPFITLSAVLGPVSNIKSGDTLTLTNNGNIDDVSTFTATIGFSTDAAGLSPVGTTASASKTLHIKAGKSVKMHSTDWTRIDSDLVAGVPYYLTVSVTDASGHTALAVSTTSFTI